MLLNFPKLKQKIFLFDEFFPKKHVLGTLELLEAKNEQREMEQEGKHTEISIISNQVKFVHAEKINRK